MRFLRPMLTLPLFFILFFSSSHFLACVKHVHDVIHDTTIVKDTIRYAVHDTLYDLTDGLIAYYNFNGGNLNDSSGMRNNITFNNAVATADRFGRPNNAYLFNGTSNYMKISNSPSLSPGNITIMSIFKLNGFYAGPCHGNQIVSKGWPDGVNGFYTLRVSDFTNVGGCSGPPNVNAEYVLGAFPGATAGADSVSMQTGVWYNVVFTYDGVKARMYINGNLKKETNATFQSVSNTYDLFIGKHEDPSYPYWFNGVIDEVRIYDEALTPDEVKQLAKITQ